MNLPCIVLDPKVVKPPEGGDKGGEVVVAGTPEAVAACAESYTGQFLKEVLG